MCYPRNKKRGNMENKRQSKDIINQERVFKAVAQNPGDINTVKERLRKAKVSSSRTKINRAIDDLIKSGRLILKDKQLYVNPSTIKHAKLVQSNGTSYLLFDGDSHQYYIDRRDAGNIPSGSRVQVGSYFLASKGKMEERSFVMGIDKSQQTKQDEIEEIVDKTDTSNIVYGRVMKTSHDELVFLPNDRRRFKKPIFIANDKRGVAKYQDKICTMQIVSNETETEQAVGFLQEIKGDAGNPIAEYDAIAESHGAIMSYSDEKVQKEIENIPTEVDLSKYQLISMGEQRTLNSAKPQIVDLRGLNFTTTDPATCKDMDDAIYSTFDEKGNLVVYAAVANVTKYVKLNSEIGRRYIQAGFTTYAPNKAYNILPPELSTNICSLNPNVPRLAFVVKTVINPKSGKPISSSIMDAVIESKEKFSYEQAQEICDEHSEITRETITDKVKKGLPLSREEQVVMNKLASDILWKGLNGRNLIQFDSDNEYDVKLNEDMSDIVDIEKEPHIPYHKVIEAFMVTANEATAEFALRNGIPNIYRVHEEPSESKIEQAYEFFDYLNIPFDGDLSPRAIKTIVASVKGTDKEKVVNNFLVRMQSKAKYCNTPNPQDVKLVGKSGHRQERTKKFGEEAKADFERKQDVVTGDIMHDAVKKLDKTISHFGLQSEHYSHTTSPIRRITDYVTHYNILAYLNGENMLDQQQVRDIALWANQMQDSVDLSEREFNELNSAIYCTHHINDVMKGHICSFRKLADKKDITPEEIVVIVENEDKGIRVQIPLVDVLAYKGVTTKKVAITPYGSAIVNKNTNSPILTVCQELTFKIAESDRITRQITGTLDLSRVIETTENSNFTAPTLPDIPVTRGGHSSKREKMLKNKRYCKEHSGDAAKIAEDEMRYGLKFKNQIKYEEFVGDMGNREAYHANKSQNRQHKRRKIEQQAKAHLEYYTSGDSDFEENDIDIEKNQDGGDQEKE